MRFEFDTLKCAKMLTRGGVQTSQAEVMIESLSGVDINNLYGKMEIDTMLNEAVRNTFEEFRRESDKRHREFNERSAERRREFDKRMAERDKQIEKDLTESRTWRRWTVGTIITCTLALAGYLSALIHLALLRIH